ncbi:MAG TPA: dihydrolipoyllysine-residue acetyltransferase [Steroidobacteraceae bacterium]
MPRVIEVRVPDMGNFKDVAVIDVLVKPGDAIEIDGPLVTLETEKATMDVPSTVAGIIDKIVASKGGTVSPGDVVATVRVEDAAAAAPAAAPPAASAAAAPKAAAAPAAPPAAPAPAPVAGAGLAPINESGFSSAHAGPSVRRFARELGVDLARVTGTGFKSRITEDDVKGFVKQALSGAGAQSGKGAVQGGRGLPSVPVVDFAAFGTVETKPLTRIQKISGARLHASWVNLPHVTQFDEADITDLEELRGKLKTKAAEKGIKLTPLAFILRACVRALHHFPTFNSSLDAGGENLVLKKYIHIGFAADTPNGLMVPVVRDADRKDIYEVARDLSELSEKARSGTLNIAQMQGGSFTISSLGGIGGTAFTPIINAPEVAILGVSRSAMKPVFKDGVFVPRLMLPLSLSYDHRVIDGALAAKFTTYLAHVLTEPRGLLEAVP